VDDQSGRFVDDDDVGFFRQIQAAVYGNACAQCRDNVFAVIGTDFQVKEWIVPIGRLKNRKGNVEDKIIHARLSI